MLKKLLSFISYKEKENNRFSIPDSSQFKSGNQKNNNISKGIFNKKKKREIKIPIPVEQLNKCAADTVIPASEESISNDIELSIKYIEECFNYPQNSDIIIRRLRVAGNIRHLFFM